MSAVPPLPYDPTDLYNALLADFEELLAQARRVTLVGSGHSTWINSGIRACFIGFIHFRPVEDWGDELNAWIIGRLEGDLSLPELDWYEDAADAIAVFTCVALGALQGKFVNGEINDVDFMSAEMHLGVFNVERQDEIERAYRQPHQDMPPLTFNMPFDDTKED